MKLIKENFDRSLDKERRIADYLEKKSNAKINESGNYIKDYEELVKSDSRTDDDDEFLGKMLRLMVNDCEYFIDREGDAELWAGNIDNQINYIKSTYDRMKKKPTWINAEQIDALKTRMYANDHTDSNAAAIDLDEGDADSSKDKIKKDKDKPIKESKEDIDAIRKDIDTLGDGDLYIYSVADKFFPKLCVKRNDTNPKYIVLWNEDEEGNVANLVKYSSPDNAVYWIKHTADSYTPEKQTGKYIKISEDLEKGVENIPASPDTSDALGVANMLNALIRDEWEAIDGYNSTIGTIMSMKDADWEGADKTIDYDAISNILADISAEENNHVGMLQKALESVSPNVSEIKSGEEEAEHVIDVDTDEETVKAEEEEVSEETL